MFLNQEKSKIRALWFIIGLILLALAACNSDDGAGSSHAASTEDAVLAPMYALSTSDEAVTDEVYIAINGNQAHIYQRGSSVNAVFCLGTFQIERKGDSLAIVLSHESRLNARERLALSMDAIKVKIAGSSTGATPADIANADSRLETIRLYFNSELADETDVEDALAAFENDTALQAILEEIISLKQAFIADAGASGDPSAGIFLAKARLIIQLVRLLANQTVLNVFHEKEILGSLLDGMDAVDREIALYYACGAMILRQEDTGLDDLDELGEIATELEQLEALSVKAAVLESRYLSFITEIGFEDENTSVDVSVATLWNNTLWESILGVFVAMDTGQYDINVSVCQPLDRLVQHCSMAGDAARAFRTMQWLDLLAEGTANGRIILEANADAWTCPEKGISLSPVKDSTLTDWNTWEQWADEIDDRI